MAKKNVIGGINWDLSAFMANEAIAKRVKTIHDTAIREAAMIAANLKPNPDKVFSFDNYPQTKKEVEKVFNVFAGKMVANVKQGNTDAFAIAHAKNDELLDYLSQKTKVSRKTLEKKYEFGARNQEGLAAFQTRKENGLGLSDRVWKISNNARKEIEFGIDLGLEEGMDASKLSRKVRENLVDPNNLFRRVRDKHGNLKLSQAAKEFSPGQGVYRSSYKNAMRLTRTEVNTAYRTADHDRWSNLDFIVGIEVKLSGSPNTCSVCQSLAGKYPKTFKFIGWHPQCRCFAIPILPTDEEYRELRLMRLNEEDTSKWESSNAVKSVPEGMTDWIDANKERAKNWKSMPYFVRDNFKEGSIKKGFKFQLPEVKKAVKAKEVIPVVKPSKLDEVVLMLDKSKVEYNDVKILQKELTESDIINRVSGGDMTKGSCSSLAFAYAGNKIGFDVLDFRDGLSRVFFSRSGTITDIAEKVGGTVAKHTNDFTKANELLRKTQVGKEYYFTSGSHASIVRKTATGYEYLELQSATSNGFKPLNNSVLKQRFGAKKSHTTYGQKYETKDCIIDIDLLKEDTGFKKVLGYINTNVTEQRKGIRGTLK